MWKSTVLILICVFGLSSGLNIKPCSSSMTVPKNVDVKGCSKAPCKIYKGSVLDAQILFSTNEATNTLKPALSAKVFGMKLPITLPAEYQDVCKHLEEGKCPLMASQNALYHIQIPVLKSYPSMATEIEVNLIGDKNKNHMCFRIDGQIV